MGFGGLFVKVIVKVVNMILECGLKKVGLFEVLKLMLSINFVILVIFFKIKGINYFILLVCLILSYCIGNVVE